MKKLKKQQDIKAKDSKSKDKKPKELKEKAKEKAKESDIALVLSQLPELDFGDEIKRLNRVTGQIEGIKKMLDAKRPLNDVMIQSKAVHSALKAVEQRILNVYLEYALAEIATLDKKKTRVEQIAGLQEIYKYVN